MYWFDGLLGMGLGDGGELTVVGFVGVNGCSFLFLWRVNNYTSYINVKVVMCRVSVVGKVCTIQKR